MPFVVQVDQVVLAASHTVDPAEVVRCLRYGDLPEHLDFLRVGVEQDVRAVAGDGHPASQVVGVEEVACVVDTDRTASLLMPLVHPGVHLLTGRCDVVPRLTGRPVPLVVQLGDHRGCPGVPVVQNHLQVPQVGGLHRREVVGAVPGVAELCAGSGGRAGVELGSVRQFDDPRRDRPVPHADVAEFAVLGE